MIRRALYFTNKAFTLIDRKNIIKITLKDLGIFSKCWEKSVVQ